MEWRGVLHTCCLPVRPGAAGRRAALPGCHSECFFVVSLENEKMSRSRSPSSKEGKRGKTLKMSLSRSPSSKKGESSKTLPAEVSLRIAQYIPRTAAFDAFRIRARHGAREIKIVASHAAVICADTCPQWDKFTKTSTPVSFPSWRFTVVRAFGALSRAVSIDSTKILQTATDTSGNSLIAILSSKRTPGSPHYEDNILLQVQNKPRAEDHGTMTTIFEGSVDAKTRVVTELKVPEDELRHIIGRLASAKFDMFVFMEGEMWEVQTEFVVSRPPRNPVSRSANIVL